MVKIDLGINSCFAIKRWPGPKNWMEIIHSQLELGLCEFSLDLLDPNTREPTKTAYIQDIVECCEDYLITIYSVSTGPSLTNSNLLLHPDLGRRINAINWFENAIEIAARIDAVAMGGYIGSGTYEILNDVKEFENSLNYLSDSLNYLSKIAYTAGLSTFLIEPVRIPTEYDFSSKIEKLIEHINSNSKISIKFCIDTLHIIKNNNWINEYGKDCEIIHLQQIKGSTKMYLPFTEENNAVGTAKIDKIIKNLEDAGITECKFIVDIIPSYNHGEKEALEEVKQSIKYIKQFL